MESLRKGKNSLSSGTSALEKLSRAGSRVKTLKPGDLVVATVRRPDDCLNCLAGEYDMCLKGNYRERGIRGANGFLSDYYAEEEEFLVKVPLELGELAVLLEPVSVAEKAVRTAFEVQNRMRGEPKTAMVTGTGVLGLITAVLLKLRGLDVICVDRSEGEYKDRIFSELGVTHFNTKKINMHDIPARVGRQVDMIFEMTGNSSVALHSIMVAGTNGVVVLASITGGDKNIMICSDCFNQGLVLGNKTVVGTVNAHRKDFKQGICDLVEAEKRWPGLAAKLITARYPPERIIEALSAMDENIKVIIEFEAYEPWKSSSEKRCQEKTGEASKGPSAGRKGA